MSKASIFALLVSALLATQAAAQIYKTTDADGNVVFTDKPPAGSSNTESVDLQHTNTAPPPPNIAPLAPPSKETEEPASEAVEVSITSPANETTIPMGGGIFDVIAGAAPGVGPGQTLQLVMDGEPQGPPQTGTLWRLENVFRGAHDLTVELRDSDGSIVATSESVRVYVLRPGL
jgi:Domain of unknown function (DUF4124)